MRQRPTNRPAWIAQLQPPRENRLDARSRHDAQLSETRHGPRELPVGDRDAHAALDNFGKCCHCDWVKFS